MNYCNNFAFDINILQTFLSSSYVYKLCNSFLIGVLAILMCVSSANDMSLSFASHHWLWQQHGSPDSRGYHVYPSNSSQYPPQPAFQSPAPYSHPSVYFQVNVLCMYIFAVNWHFAQTWSRNYFLQTLITLVVYVATQHIHHHGNLNGNFQCMLRSYLKWSYALK